MAEPVRATVVFASSEAQHVLPVELPPGATLGDAVAASGLLRIEPSLSGQPLDLGVFNQPRAADTPLRTGDRVEVYRPLRIDPKEARRLRAEVRRQRRSVKSGQSGTAR